MSNAENKIETLTENSEKKLDIAVFNEAYVPSIKELTYDEDRTINYAKSVF